MKINIGAGYKKYPGLIRIDSDPQTNPDHLINLETDKLPFEDSSVEFVLAEHLLEHIGDGFFHLIQELYRVCKHGAIINITVPHPLHEVFLADPTHKRPITVNTFKLFSKTFNKIDIERNGHCSPLGLQYDVDFEVVGYQYTHDPFYDELKTKLSQAELERLFREAANTTTEIHIQLMVNK